MSRTYRLAPLLILALAACQGKGGTAGPRVVLTSLADHAANFPIAVGDVHGPATGQTWPDCFACHADVSSGTRQYPSSMKIFTCSGCHVATMGGFLHDDKAAVTAAHVGVSNFDAQVASQGFDAACYGCHKNGQGGAPADHALRFPLPHPGAAGGTSQAACADCHTNRTAPQDVTTLGCATCHDQRPTFAAAHAGVASFSDTPAACVRCHPAGEHLSVATHTPFLLAPTADVTAPKHLASALTGGDCFGCHTTQGTAATATALAKAYAQDFSQFNCGGCHVQVGPAASAADHAGTVDVLAAMHLATSHVSSLADFTTQVAAKGGWPAACFACHGDGTSVSLPPNHKTQLFPLPHPGAAGAPSVATCADCHLDPLHRTDVTQLGCAKCHDARPTFAAAHTGVASFSDTPAACVRCHPLGEHLGVATHSPFLLAPTTASPTVRHLASALTGGDCFQCHPTLGTAATTTPAMPAKAYAQDFTSTTCVACHATVGHATSTTADHTVQAQVAALHVANGGVGTTADFDAAVTSAGSLSAACLKCHADGTGVALPSNHATALFPLPHPGATGAPSTAGCTDCHRDSAHKTDVTTLGCATCHDQRPGFSTAHAGVASFSDTPAACVRCHPMGEHLAIATHTPFLLAPTTAAATVRHLASALTGGDCFQCHPAQGTAAVTTPVAMPAKAYAQDFKSQSCVACHVTVGHATTTTADHTVQAQLATLHVANGGVGAVADFNTAVTTAGSLTAACLQCHGAGLADAAPADHATWFPIGAGTKHAGIGCSQCHTNPANRKDLTAFACAGCHANDTAPTLTAGHTVTGYTITSYQTAATAGGTRSTVTVDMTNSQNCLKCHGDGQVDPVANHNASNQGFGTGRHKTGGCFTCHFTLRTDKTYALAFTTPPQSVDTAGPPPKGCYVCHASGTGN